VYSIRGHAIITGQIFGDVRSRDSKTWPDGIPDPVEMQLTLSARDANDIKSARNLVGQLMMLQINRGRPEQFLLFAVIDTGERTHKITSTAEADLDKDQYLLIVHDQINFPEPTMIV